MWLRVGSIAAVLTLACQSNPKTEAAKPAPHQPAAKPKPAPKAARDGVGAHKPSEVAPPPATATAAEIPTRYPAAPRVVAIGDVHGDLQATRAALRLAGAITESSDDWAGGKLVIVQTGDQLDRGDGEMEIFALLERLSAQAAEAGGALHILNGNHEFMNTLGDLRYVTPGGLAQFEKDPTFNVADPRLAGRPPAERARLAAFLPGAPYAKILSKRNTVVIVGRSVFVHGGVLPQHVPGGVPDLERLNADTRAWLSGAKSTADARSVAKQIMATDSVVWTRLYADETPDVCETLVATLNLLDADRMVVGHTVQKQGVTSGCSGRLWRIDVGMSAHYGGTPQALLIAGDEVTTLGGGR